MEGIVGRALAKATEVLVGNGPGKGGGIKKPVGKKNFHSFGQTRLEADWSVGFGEPVF